ncbi:hypothetical protein [Kitasatospora kifunensis]|uniref:NCAIR mutase (PurE)-related protein n=1 Tax=Kitasatospora kifunensis TaxID=58351 RepID=A0A7W7VZL4_KITKI|nr:hypothetical protein [Kitasatospora kifunensis]MBB4928681.1 NCAIR mutase (PurE)-related protein [Kitasatospora kifunensis]
MHPTRVHDLDFAQLDIGREQRQGLPEVVYGPGKTPEQIRAIVGELPRHNCGPVLVTRVDSGTAGEVPAHLPGGSYDALARLLAMQASCAAGITAGITVVNIDSGFGAAMAAHRLAWAGRRRA